MLDFPASPVEGNWFNHPTAPNTFNYTGGKWRQERAWVHLHRVRNVTQIMPPREFGAELQDYGDGHYIALPAGYQFYKILLRRFEPYTSTGPSVFRVSGDNGVSYLDAGYVWNGVYQYAANAPASWYQGQWTGSNGYVPMTASMAPIVNNGGPNMFAIDIDRGGGGVAASFTLHSCVYAPTQGFMHTMVSGYVSGTQANGMTHIGFYYMDYAAQYQHLNSTLGALDVFGAPMMFDFPSSPAENQEYASGGQTFIYKAPTWMLKSASVASVGGANTQVQFNDAGVLGGDADLTWDKTNNKLAIGTADNGKIYGAGGAHTPVQLRLSGTAPVLGLEIETYSGALPLTDLAFKNPGGSTTFRSERRVGSFIGAGNTYEFQVLADDGQPIVAYGGSTVAYAKPLQLPGLPTQSYHAATKAYVDSKASGREVLTAARNYYVNVGTGADTNDGLTAGAPFKTIMKAWNVATKTLDCAGFKVEIRLADGNYTAEGTLNLDANDMVGIGTDYSNRIIIWGNYTTPANIILPQLNCLGGAIGIGGLAVNGVIGAYDEGTVVDVSTVHINTGGYLSVDRGGYMRIAGAVTWNGTHTYGIQGYNGGRFLWNSGNFVVNNSPNWTAAFLDLAYGASFVVANGAQTVTGTATGLRFRLTYGSWACGAGMTDTKLPGSTAGTIDANGSWYQTFPTPSGLPIALTADKTFYVRTDGSDSNDGSASTAGSAFLTIQKGLDECAKYDCSKFGLRVSIADGTYAGALNFPAQPGALLGQTTFADGANIGPGYVCVNGNNSTPASVTISAAVNIKKPTSVRFHGVQFSNANHQVWGTGVQAMYGSVWWSGASGNGPDARFGSTVYFVGAITTNTASVNCLCSCYYGSTIHFSSGAAATANVATSFLTGAVQCAYGGKIITHTTFTITGTFTGGRYVVTYGGLVCGVSSGNANYFPGSTAGTVGQGGQYI